MHSHSHHPIGYHCERYDMRLLTQIIAVDMDLALRKLQNNYGVSIHPAQQEKWVAEITEIVKQETFSQIDAHSFLPAVLQRKIQEEIEHIVEKQRPKAKSSFLHAIHQRIRLSRAFVSVSIFVAYLAEKSLE